MSTYVITGATGNTGKPIALGLLERGHAVRVLSRSAARAKELKCVVCPPMTPLPGYSPGRNAIDLPVSITTRNAGIGVRPRMSARLGMNQTETGLRNSTPPASQSRIGLATPSTPCALTTQPTRTS